MMTEYICVFQNHTVANSFKRETLIPSLSVAQNGFWVDSAFKFCNNSKSVYWIPPSQVLRVKKKYKPQESKLKPRA